MKKLFLYMLLGLLCCSNVYAANICTGGNFKGLEITCYSGEIFNQEKCSCHETVELLLPLKFLDSKSWMDKHEAKEKIKLDKFNSKRNKQFGIIVIFLLILTFILIKFKKKIEYRISKLTKLDKGLFRVWITLSILWFLASLFYSIIEWDLLFFHYAGFSLGNISYYPEHTPFHAFFSILIVCVLPSFLVVLSWLIIKWIRRGFK